MPQPERTGPLRPWRAHRYSHLVRRVKFFYAAPCLLLLAMSGCGTAEVNDQIGVSVEEQMSLTGRSAEQNFAFTERLIRECMAEQGFAHTERTLHSRDFVPYPTIGSWTMELADELGLGVTTTVQGTFDDNILDNPNETLIEQLSPDEYRAWDYAWRGDPSDREHVGCRNQVKREINAAWVDEMQPIQAAYVDMVQTLFADPRLVELDRTWSTCFASAGFGSYESFDDLVKDQQSIAMSLDPGDNEAVTAAEDHERELARAAVRCSESLRQDWLEVWDEYQSDFAETVEIPDIATS